MKNQNKIQKLISKKMLSEKLLKVLGLAVDVLTSRVIFTSRENLVVLPERLLNLRFIILKDFVEIISARSG